jgi:hypothetical protein
MLTYAGKSYDTDVSAFVIGGDSKSADTSVQVIEAVTGVPAVVTGPQMRIFVIRKQLVQKTDVVVPEAIIPNKPARSL